MTSSITKLIKENIFYVVALVLVVTGNLVYSPWSAYTSQPLDRVFFNQVQEIETAISATTHWNAKYFLAHVGERYSTLTTLKAPLLLSVVIFCAFCMCWKLAISFASKKLGGEQGSGFAIRTFRDIAVNGLGAYIASILAYHTYIRYVTELYQEAEKNSAAARSSAKSLLIYLIAIAVLVVLPVAALEILHFMLYFLFVNILGGFGDMIIPLILFVPYMILVEGFLMNKIESIMLPEDTINPVKINLSMYCLDRKLIKIVIMLLAIGGLFTILQYGGAVNDADLIDYNGDYHNFLKESLSVMMPQ